MKIYLFLTLIFFGFYIPKASAGPEVNYYRDIDYWTLEGVNELPPTELNKYPYFKITKLDNANRLIELITKMGSYREHYVWKDNSWMMRNERSGNTSHVYQYTFVSNNKILVLEYLAVLSFEDGKWPKERRLTRMMRRIGNKRHFLMSVSLRDSASATNYILSRGQKIWSRPSGRFDENLKDLKIETTVKSLYRLAGDQLVEEISTEHLNNRYVNVICYTLNDQWGYKHNLFWPLFFPERVECD